MDVADKVEKVHNVPVPERFLPLVYKALADAHRDEANARSRGDDASGQAPAEEDPREWTEDEVVRAYRESSFRQRAALEYLADNLEHEVSSRELARAVYPDDDPEIAEGKLYGVLGAFGRRASSKYGKKKWFFRGYRERLDNGKLGYFIYKMPAEKAAWVQKASGKES